MEAFRRLRLLNSATSADDSVTPVYVLDEICDLVKASSPDVVKDIQDYLIKRMNKESPIIKQKVLRIIKVVCRKDTTFRKGMQRHVAAVRAMLQFKGVQEELRGDALNKAVRDTAKDALAAIFEEQAAPSGTDAAASAVKSRIQGFGSSEYGGPAPSGSDSGARSSSGGIVGFGNPIFSKLTSLSGKFSQPTNATASSGINFTWSARGTSSDATRGDSYANRSSDSYSGYSPQQELPEYSPAASGPATSGGGVTSASGDAYFGGGYSEASGGEAVTEEARLVNNVTAPGGVRAQPSREALRLLVQAAASLDAEVLAAAIESKLTGRNWQVRLKAMCVLEALLRPPPPGSGEGEARAAAQRAYEQVGAFFMERLECVVECARSPHPSLRDKSLQVISLLGITEEEMRSLGLAPSSSTGEERSNGGGAAAGADAGSARRHQQSSTSPSDAAAAAAPSQPPVMGDLLGSESPLLMSPIASGSRGQAFEVGGDLMQLQVPGMDTAPLVPAASHVPALSGHGRSSSGGGGGAMLGAATAPLPSSQGDGGDIFSGMKVRAGPDEASLATGGNSAGSRVGRTGADGVSGLFEGMSLVMSAGHGGDDVSAAGQPKPSPQQPGGSLLDDLAMPPAASASGSGAPSLGNGSTMDLLAGLSADAPSKESSRAGSQPKPLNVAELYPSGNYAAGAIGGMAMPMAMPTGGYPIGGQMMYGHPGHPGMYQGVQANGFGMPGMAGHAPGMGAGFLPVGYMPGYPAGMPGYPSGMPGYPAGMPGYPPGGSVTMARINTMAGAAPIGAGNGHSTRHGSSGGGDPFSFTPGAANVALNGERLSPKKSDVFDFITGELSAARTIKQGSK
eukprot:jgi/Mesvir1/23762/Mv06218-RA.2